MYIFDYVIFCKLRFHSSHFSKKVSKTALIFNACPTCAFALITLLQCFNCCMCKEKTKKNLHKTKVWRYINYQISWKTFINLLTLTDSMDTNMIHVYQNYVSIIQMHAIIKMRYGKGVKAQALYWPFLESHVKNTGRNCSWKCARPWHINHETGSRR